MIAQALARSGEMVLSGGNAFVTWVQSATRLPVSKEDPRFLSPDPSVCVFLPFRCEVEISVSICFFCRHRLNIPPLALHAYIYNFATHEPAFTLKAPPAAAIFLAVAKHFCLSSSYRFRLLSTAEMDGCLLFPHRAPARGLRASTHICLSKIASVISPSI